MSFDVGIIGGGLIGLACARELARRGARIALFDKAQPGCEASWAGAGMLGAQCEAARYPPTANGDHLAPQQAMFALCLRSRALYPAFATALRDETGIDIELLLDEAPRGDWRLPGMDYIATAPDDITPQRLLAQAGWGQRAQERPLAEIGLPSVGHLADVAQSDQYIHLPDEGQVENRKLVEALTAATLSAGGQILHGHEVTGLRHESGRVTGLVVNGETVACDQVLVCAGAWSGGIAGLPDDCTPRVRPIAGQIVMVRARTLRRVLYASDVYLVPRRDGRLLVGATMEEVGFEKRTTLEAGERLLTAASRLVPELTGCAIEAHWAGLRPGSHDGLPMLGATPLAGLFIATGHFRNGILLTPLTGQLMAECMLEGGATPEHFRVDRFAPQTV